MPRREARADLLEQRPEDCPLSLWEPRFSTEARDISIRLPGIQLPRINDLLPLGQQEPPTELVALSTFAGGPQQLVDDLWRCQIDLPEVGLVEALSVALIEWTSSRSAKRGSLLMSRLIWVRRAFASMCENVVSKTRAFWLARARKTARCSATIVFPVPAEPETLAGPV